MAFWKLFQIGFDNPVLHDKESVLIDLVYILLDVVTRRIVSTKSCWISYQIEELSLEVVVSPDHYRELAISG
jgi:predicted ATP-grasp superfamily ATP-dependent carboligase